MKFKYGPIILVCLFYSQAILAIDFQKVTIPEAKCGNGADYVVYIKKNSDKKLLIEFMGGGACWNYESCFVHPKTSLDPITSSGPTNFLTTEELDNPFKKHSMLYFPYCTGDVHIGTHIANYNGKVVFHYGNKNINLALKYLQKKNLIAFNSFEDVTIWGASAGGIASIIYGKQIESLLNISAKKTLIPDSPGLHFGERFWDKFSSETKADYISALATIHIVPDLHDGFVARKLRTTFAAYNKWNLGFLIATKDKVMSTVFGDISPEDHEKLVLGPEGIPAIASEFPHIKVWLQSSTTHTFLVSKKSSESESMEKVKAIDFVKEVLNENNP